ncbi:MAG: hypothetical protein ACC653_09605 [Gammaproteobacteria bacterium]
MIKAKIMLNTSLSILALSISACAITPKTPPVIKSAEQNNAFISGVVKGDKYIAMDNSFTINLPYKKGSREYELMEIDEFYSEKGAHVSFGVQGKNSNIFNLEIKAILDENTFEQQSAKLLTQYRSDLFLDYRSKPRLLKKYKFKIRGYDAIHWNLFQKISPQQATNLGYGLVNHQVFAINLGDKVAFIWVQKTANKANQHNKIVTAYDFATSLSIPKKNVDVNLLSSIQ